MARAAFDITTLPTTVLAYVGVTDLAVEKLRDAAADVQKRVAAGQKGVTARVADAQKDVTARVVDVQKLATEPQVLRDQALTVVSARVDALAKDAQARREAVEARVAELQAYPRRVQGLLRETVAGSAATYDDLVKRGETLVGRIRRQKSSQDTVASARTTVTKAKTTATQARGAAQAERTATTAARKAAAKKAPATTRTGKKSASTTPAAKKSTARKAATRKTATARSSANATATAARKTAANATKAVADAAEKVGD